MTPLSDDDLQLLYPDSDSDYTSIGSPSLSAFLPSTASSALILSDNVRRIISCSPAAIKYCREVEPAFPYHETTSHSAKRDSDHIPRPPNAFFLFRSHLVANEPRGEKKNNVLSQQAGRVWRSLSWHEKAPFEDAARIVQERHAVKYPAYKYKPSAGKGKSGKKAGSSSEAKKGSKMRRSSKPRVTVAASPSRALSSFSSQESFPQLAMPTPTFAMPSTFQLLTFDVPSPQPFAPEFSFTATSQISPMMLPGPLVDNVAQSLATACKVVEPYNMAADEGVLIAPSYTGELPLDMYDVPADVAEIMNAFPPMHAPTLDYSPELTPPPYDTSAPGWQRALEAASLEMDADDMFAQYIDVNAF